MSPVPVVIVDRGCGIDRALLADIAEMCATVSQTQFARPDPYGWAVGASMRVAQSETDIAPGEIVIALERTPNAPGALGDHDVGPDGRPAGHVFPFLESDPADLAVTISHELFELLADAPCTWLAVGDDGVIRALETADPVETDWFEFIASSGRSLRCSNWVTPAYFSGAAPGVPLDHMGLVRSSGEIRAGGYQIVLDPSTGRWSQQTNGIKRAYRRAVGELGITRLAKRARKAP